MTAFLAPSPPCPAALPLHNVELAARAVHPWTPLANDSFHLRPLATTQCRAMCTGGRLAHPWMSAARAIRRYLPHRAYSAMRNPYNPQSETEWQQSPSLWLSDALAASGETPAVLVLLWTLSRQSIPRNTVSPMLWIPCGVAQGTGLRALCTRGRNEIRSQHRALR